MPLVISGIFDRSVFLDFDDGCHRAFLHAVATGGAGVLVDDSGFVLDYVQHVVAASVSTDSATGAFFGVDNRTWHIALPSFHHAAGYAAAKDIRVNIYQTASTGKREIHLEQAWTALSGLERPRTVLNNPRVKTEQQ